jgi:hypothetical protein
MLLFYYVIILLCYYVIMLLFYYVIMVLYYYCVIIIANILNFGNGVFLGIRIRFKMLTHFLSKASEMSKTSEMSERSNTSKTSIEVDKENSPTK